MNISARFLIISAVVTCFALQVRAREVISINKGWSFTPSVSSGFSEEAVKVDLPHTWNAADFMSDEGYRRGWGTYVRKLDIPESYRGKRVFLKFEAAGSMAIVILNGRKTDGYGTIVWEGARLSKGRNEVVVRTDHGEDSAIWNVE